MEGELVGLPEALAQVVRACCSRLPEDRPPFTRLREQMQELAVAEAARWDAEAAAEKAAARIAEARAPPDPTAGARDAGALCGREWEQACAATRAFRTHVPDTRLSLFLPIRVLQRTTQAVHEGDEESSDAEMTTYPRRVNYPEAVHPISGGKESGPHRHDR